MIHSLALSKRVDEEIERLRAELICAEDCHCHRPVAVIREEIRAVIHERDEAMAHA